MTEPDLSFEKTKSTDTQKADITSTQPNTFAVSHHLRLSCPYCFRTLDPADPCEPLRRFVQAETDKKIYHEPCWQALTKVTNNDPQACQPCTVTSPPPLEFANVRQPIMIYHPNYKNPFQNYSKFLFILPIITVIAFLLLNSRNQDKNIENANLTMTQASIATSTAVAAANTRNTHKQSTLNAQATKAAINTATAVAVANRDRQQQGNTNPPPTRAAITTATATSIVIKKPVFATIYPFSDVLNVRRSPSDSSNEGNVVDRLKEGERVEILDGPQRTGEFTWWKVRTPRGKEGWCVENVKGYQTLIFDDDTTETFLACSGAPLSRMHIGYQGRTNPYDSSSTVVRDAPAIGKHIVEIGPGETFDVLGGPECGIVRNINYAWWRIRVHKWNVVGWIAEGIKGNYWIEPLSKPNAQ